MIRVLGRFAALKGKGVLDENMFPWKQCFADPSSVSSFFSLCCLLPSSLHIEFPKGTGLVHSYLFGAFGLDSPLSEKVLW